MAIYKEEFYIASCIANITSSPEGVFLVAAFVAPRATNIT